MSEYKTPEEIARLAETTQVEPFGFPIQDPETSKPPKPGSIKVGGTIAMFEGEVETVPVIAEVVLTLDVAFNNVGWGVIFRYVGGKEAVFGRGNMGHKAVSKKERARLSLKVNDIDLPRCAQIATETAGLIKSYSVTSVVAEMPEGSTQGARSAACMAMAKAVIAAVCALLGIEEKWVPPSLGKIATCGDRNADKKDVEAAVRRHFPALAGAKMTEHEADALAAYIGAYHKYKAPEEI